MGSKQTQPLLDKWNEQLKTGRINIGDALSDFIHFSHVAEHQEKVYHEDLQNNPSNRETFMNYGSSLMKVGKRDLGIKYINLYWKMCDKTFMDHILIIQALHDGECFNLSRKYCKLAMNNLKNGYWKSESPENKVRFYMHYSHDKWFRQPSLKRVNKYFKKVISLINKYPRKIPEGFLYQTRLQLATNYTSFGKYNEALKQMKYILKYEDGICFNEEDCIIVVNKNKIFKIYGEIMMVMGKYDIALQYLLKVTDDKDPVNCVALSQYSINGLLMRCYIEIGDFDKAMVCYHDAVQKVKNQEIKSINNKVLDMQHCFGLCLLAKMRQNDMNEALAWYGLLAQVQDSTPVGLFCLISSAYLAYYKFKYLYLADEYEVILQFLNMIYGTTVNIGRYPEIYYLFADCLMDLQNVMSSRKYIKKIYKYNKSERRVKKLNERINEEFANLRCMQCKTDTDKLRACGGCGKVVYCSKLCQKISWNEEHRLICDGKFRKFCRVRKDLRGKEQSKDLANNIIIPMTNSVYHQ